MRWKKLWSLKDLPLVSFVCRRINARAAALIMRAWWKKPFLPKSSNILRIQFSFSNQNQIYRCLDTFSCTWVFIGSTDIFVKSCISWKSKIWKENNNISREHIKSDKKILPGVACSSADWSTADGCISRFFSSLSNSMPVWAENNSFAFAFAFASQHLNEILQCAAKSILLGPLQS